MRLTQVPHPITMYACRVLPALAAFVATVSIGAAAVVADLPPHPILNISELDFQGNRLNPELSFSVRQKNLGATDPVNAAGFLAGGGSILYGGFDGQLRVNSANALINSDTMSRNLGSSPLKSIEPAGFNAIGVTGRLRNKCHQIAAQLGGSGRDAQNLFTCHRYGNFPLMFHYEDKVAKLLATFPTAGHTPQDEGVRVKVVPWYGANTFGNGVPVWVRYRSELHMNGLFVRVLQDLWLYMGPSGNTAGVSFICSGGGIFADSAPPSLAANRIRTVATPC